MKIFKLLLLAIATSIMIAGCGGGTIIPNPPNTDWGTVTADDNFKTVTFIPSVQAGTLFNGNVYASLTKNGVSIGNTILLTSAPNSSWTLDYTGNPTTTLYQDVVNGTYSGTYLLTVKILVNGADEKIVIADLPITLNFVKNVIGGDGPPDVPPGW